jgi:hypothetical protein
MLKTVFMAVKLAVDSKIADHKHENIRQKE